MPCQDENNASHAMLMPWYTTTKGSSMKTRPCMPCQDKKSTSHAMQCNAICHAMPCHAMPKQQQEDPCMFKKSIMHACHAQLAMRPCHAKPRLKKKKKKKKQHTHTHMQVRPTHAMSRKAGAPTKQCNQLFTSSIATLKPLLHKKCNISLPPLNCLPTSTANALQEY